ncbi:hypothetical protein [Roseivirga sp. E12]|uniref:hypothetical protein n=1 Tax=Roseivirga sp. E12 TaxID=2819237 RepID=UPI001ABC0662|nr:hypothetical protein [Roseivirga sp. E12]MBO3700282.1 hypothetical protein [Roseivirga sp. E12]
MLEIIATILLLLLALYVLIGIVFYFPFIKKGVHKIDEGVKDAPKFMKVLIFPGTVALWPILLKKVKKGELS